MWGYQTHTHTHDTQHAHIYIFTRSFVADTGIYSVCVCVRVQCLSQFVFLALSNTVLCAEVTIQCHKLAFVELSLECLALHLFEF